MRPSSRQARDAVAAHATKQRDNVITMWTITEYAADVIARKARWDLTYRQGRVHLSHGHIAR